MLVRDTVISGSAGDGIWLGGQIGTVTINRAKIKTGNIGINVADASATTLKLVLTTSLIYNNNSNRVLYNVPLGSGFNLYHNTFYDNSRTDVNKINFSVLNQAGEAKLQNNLFYSSAAMTHLYVALALVNGLVNNNCYNNQTNMFGYNSSVYSTVANFTVATSFEANGVGGSSVNLTNAAGEIFTLQATSQCLSSGASGLGVPLDYVLYNYASPPSSGAYQYH